MNAAATQDIVFDQFLPHTPETVWKALTSGDLIGRWLMEPTGFAPVVGNRFTYKTSSAGKWDGTIHCEVMEVDPGRRFAYAWKGGDQGNEGYGSPLDTVVTFTLMPTQGGTRLRLVHSGFLTPRNDTAFTNMSEGWKKVVARMDDVMAERSPAKH